MTRKPLRAFQALSSAASDDRGATAIIVAICMVVLMGFAALAIDGGLGFDDRRGTQNAADNAALAAAWEACNPVNTPPDPEGAALAVAAENGYDDASAETAVTVTQLSPTEYEVEIETSNDTTFAAVGANSDTVSVVSRAIGTCEEEPFLGGYAIFAGAESCSNGGALELDLTGSTKTINGGIFSNGDMLINGPNTTINGVVEYRGNFNSNAGVSAEQYFGSPKPYPLDLAFSDFGPGGFYRTNYPANFFDANGLQIDNGWMTTHNYAVDGPNGPGQPKIIIQQSGIYYTSRPGNNAITLQDVAVAPGVTVTFVAAGEISVIGKTDITGFAPVDQGGYTPLLMFSNRGNPPQCNDGAISFSGSDMEWTGLIFAPNGSINMASSDNVTLSGSIIGHSVSVSGSNFTITWQDDPNAAPRFVVELQE